MQPAPRSRPPASGCGGAGPAAPRCGAAETRRTACAPADTRAPDSTVVEPRDLPRAFVALASERERAGRKPGVLKQFVLDLRRALSDRDDLTWGQPEPWNVGRAAPDVRADSRCGRLAGRRRAA